MTVKSSFYSDSATVYTETSPPGPVSAPLSNAVNPAPSSMYKNTGPILSSMMEAGFNLAIAIPGTPLKSSEWLFGYKFDFAATFAANMGGSQAVAAVAATGTPVLSLRKNGVEFATLTFTGTTGVFSGPQTVFAFGDLLELVAPATTDTTLAQLSINLFGTRN